MQDNTWTLGLQYFCRSVQWDPRGRLQTQGGPSPGACPWHPKVRTVRGPSPDAVRGEGCAHLLSSEAGSVGSNVIVLCLNQAEGGQPGQQDSKEHVPAKNKFQDKKWFPFSCFGVNLIKQILSFNNKSCFELRYC